MAIRQTGKHASQKDYTPNHNFGLEINGILSAGFQQVSGLKQEIEVIEYRDGDSGNVTLTRAGKYKPVRVKLTRGQVNDDTLRKWFNEVLNGMTNRQPVSIIAYGRDAKETKRYNLFEAWPCEWEGPEFNSKSDGHITESVTLVAERLEMVVGK